MDTTVYVKLSASATTAGMHRGGGEDGGVAAVSGLSLASKRICRTSGLRGAHTDSVIFFGIVEVENHGGDHGHLLRKTALETRNSPASTASRMRERSE